MWFAIQSAIVATKALMDPEDPTREEIKDLWQEAKAATREYFDEKEAEEFARAKEIVADPVSAGAIELQQARQTIKQIEEKRKQREKAAAEREAAKVQREREKLEAKFAKDAQAEARTLAEQRAKAEAERSATSSLIEEAEAILADPLASEDDLQFARGVVARFGSPSS